MQKSTLKISELRTDYDSENLVPIAEGRRGEATNVLSFSSFSIIRIIILTSISSWKHWPMFIKQTFWKKTL